MTQQQEEHEHTSIPWTTWLGIAVPILAVVLIALVVLSTNNSN